MSIRVASWVEFHVFASRENPTSNWSLFVLNAQIVDNDAEWSGMVWESGRVSISSWASLQKTRQ